MTRPQPRPLSALFVIAALAAAPSAWSAPRYHLVDLGENTSAEFLQDGGIVTGYQASGDFLPGAWYHGRWRWYGQLNDQVTVSRHGDAVAVAADTTEAGLRMRDGTKRRLTVDAAHEIDYFVPLGDGASALAQVNFFDAGGNVRRTCGYWGPGQTVVTLLPVVDGTGCIPAAIARDGRVVGSGQRAPFQVFQAFTWVPGGSLQFLSPEGDTTPSMANAVNRFGHIALQAGSPTQAAWFDGTQIRLLGNPPGMTSSAVTGIDAADEMVGFGLGTTGGALYFWSGPTAAPVLLDSLVDDLGGLTLTYFGGAGMDDRGEILVNAGGAGVAHAVLLEPIAD